jgi:hypothetical protein
MHKSAELFNKRVGTCLDMVRVDYGNIFDIPSKASILLNYEHMPDNILAHASTMVAPKEPLNVISLNAKRTDKEWQVYEEIVIPHELAHIVCYTNGIDDGHGATWGELCLSMGGIDSRFISSKEQK